MVGGDPCDGDVFDGGPGNDDANFFRFTPGVNAQIGGPVSRDGGSCTPGRIDGSVEAIEGSPGPDVLIGSHERATRCYGKGGRRLAVRPRRQRHLSRRARQRPPRRRPRPRQRIRVAEAQRARSPPRRAAARTGRARSPRASKRVALAAEDGEHVGARRSAIGATSRPPSASWPSRVRGGAGAAAWTAIASKGARSGRPRPPSPTITSTLPSPSSADRPPRPRGERRQQLDPDHLAREQRQDGGRVAGAGADLEHPLLALAAAAPGRSRRRSRAGRSSAPRRSAAPSRHRRGGAGRPGTNSSRGTRPSPSSTRSSSISAPAQLPLDHPGAKGGEVRSRCARAA